MTRPISPAPKPVTAATRGRQNVQRGKKFERDVAAALGGRRVPLSGGGSIKGDVYDKDGIALLECKTSTAITSKGAKSIGIEEEWLTKAEGEAASEGKLLWALPFHMKGSRRTWVATDWNIMQTAILLIGYLLRLVAYLEKHHPDALAAVPYTGPALGLPIFTVGGKDEE